MNGNYFVYITTNPGKTVLYTGVTNDLDRRMKEHYAERGKFKTFAGRYYCHRLVFYQRFDNSMDAIDAEKEIKSWPRADKMDLVEGMNPEWKFLNDEIEEE